MKSDDVFPERHLLRDLRTSTQQISDTRSMSVTPLVDELRDRSGAPSLALLATVADVNASLVALVAARPDWTATVSLGLRATERLRVVEGPIVADATLERAGSKIIVVHTLVRDGRGRTADEILDDAERSSGTDDDIIAVGIVTFTRIPGSASRASSRFDASAMIGVRRHPPSDGTSLTQTLEREIAWQTIDAERGVVELEPSTYVRNTFGAITGGVHGMLLQAAAELANPGSVTTGLDLHYLAQARRGPVRTTLQRLGDDCMEIRLVEDGATVTFGYVTVAR